MLFVVSNGYPDALGDRNDVNALYIGLKCELNWLAPKVIFHGLNYLH